ncbi:hypothetical protein [Bradyrhizobium sp. RDT46]|uniref:hypothetical protein n=1 Tax=Bradyrhizobium sp. RDT46 TaxID=3341829 RepID=UPI0035C69318
MKALDAVIIGKTLDGKSTEAGKVRRFGRGSKPVEGMIAGSFPCGTDEPAPSAWRQDSEAAPGCGAAA